MIKGEAGKTKVIKALKVIDGVVDLEIDIKTYYSQVGASLVDIIEEINDAGFDADNKKTTKDSGNTCRGAISYCTSVNAQKLTDEWRF